MIQLISSSSYRGSLLLATLVCAQFVWTAGVAETGVKPDPAAVARGATLYDKHCMRCHRKDGIGEAQVPWSIRRPDLVEAMPLNEASHAWHHGDEQLAAMILNGTPRSRTRMPMFRDVLSTKEVTDLVAYLKSLWSAPILACQGPAHMRCM